MEVLSLSRDRVSKKTCYLFLRVEIGGKIGPGKKGRQKKRKQVGMLIAENR